VKHSGKLIQIEHGLSEINPINVGLVFFDLFTSKKFGFHLKRNHLKNLESAGFKITYQRKLDPIGIFRLLVSKKPYN